MKHRIREILEQRGIKQQQLVDALGVNKSHISNILNEKRDPSLETLQEIARFLQVPVRDLFRGSGEPVLGFSEPPIQDFTPAKVARLLPTTRALVPNAQRPDTFRANRSQTAFGILAGDLLVADMTPDSATDGDIVLATLVNTQTGAGQTVLGRLVGEHLAGADASEPIFRIGGQDIAIMGVVRGVMRGPGAQTL